MTIDKSQVKRILVITLSNVGDVILTMPVIATLAGQFPTARIDVVVGPRGKEIFEKDPRIAKLMIYDKHCSLKEKARLQIRLKKLKYDLVADLRNTVLPLLIGAKFRTATIQSFPKSIVHRKDRHLHRLRSLGIEESAPSYIYIPEEDDRHAVSLLKEAGPGERTVVVNPGAKSHLKRWTADGFAKLCDMLIGDCAARVILVGLGEDAKVVDEIVSKMNRKAVNFVNRTNIRQLASLLKHSDLLITNDSAPLHIGCAVGVKVLAVFGPTDPKKYGPTGEFDTVVNKKLSCSPCEKAACALNYECMRLITPEEIFDSAKMMLEGYE